jgi:hypothetical protein
VPATSCEISDTASSDLGAGQQCPESDSFAILTRDELGAETFAGFSCSDGRVIGDGSLPLRLHKGHFVGSGKVRTNKITKDFTLCISFTLFLQPFVVVPFEHSHYQGCTAGSVTFPLQ